MANKISVVIDVAVDKANRSLQSFRQSINDADGATNKFKAGASGAFDAVKANAGALAIGAGTALLTFGAKAVSAFQDTALMAGKLRDSLGLTAEEASQFMEVAGDLGIPVGTFEAAIGKMNQTMARTPQLFADLGVEMAKNADGTDNVRQNFLNTIDALNNIPSATQRADAAQRIFGRNWREISEMIGRGSEDLLKNLEAVGDAKVIDDDEVQRARDFRDTMDELGDKGEEALTALGGELVPVVGLIADAVTQTISWVQALRDVGGGKSGDNFFGNLWDQAGWFVENIRTGRAPWEAFGNQTEENAKSVDAFSVSATAAAIGTVAMEEATEESTAAFDDMAEAAKRGTEQIKDAIAAYEDAEEAQRGMQSASLSYRQQVADTARAVAESTLVQLDAKRTDEERAQAARDAESAVLAQADAAVQLAEDQAAANGETLSADEKTKIYVEELYTLAATLSGPVRAELEAHIQRLLGIPGAIYTDIGVSTGAAAGRNVQVKSGSKFHSGGVVGVGNFASDEVPAVLRKGEVVLDKGQQASVASAMAGGGGTTTVNVYVNGGDPETVIAAIRKHVKRGGTIPGVPS